jgi:sec-independent protein translocase protein TatC
MTEGDRPADDESDDGEEQASDTAADQSEADSRVDTSDDPGSDNIDDPIDGSTADSSGSDTPEQTDTREAADSPDVEAHEVPGVTDTGGGEADDTAHGTDGTEADDAGADGREVDDADLEETGSPEAVEADADGNLEEDKTDADAETETETDEFESAPAADTAGAAGASGAASGAGMATPAGAGAGGGGGGGGGIGTGTGAPDDQEMPLTDHIEEMVKRLGIVIVVMAAISAVTFPFADRLINFLWYSFLPGVPSECAAAAIDAFESTGGAATTSDAACPRLYHPLALLLARLKVASLTGFVIALPVFVYQTYLFMRPGLYPNERRYYLSSVPTSLLLAGIGLAFAHLLVLPVIFTYFLGYSQPVAEIAFGLADTFNLIVLMLGMFALIFQIPLFVMLAIMMGVTTRNWLEDRRLYFWAGFAGLAFLFSPDPTGMAPFIVAVTMIVLFEGTLLLLRWTGR